MTARPIRRFTELVGLLDRGEFERKCDEALGAALQTLEALPKEQGTAKIIVELTIAFDSGRVDVQPVLKSKLPEGQAFGRTPLWVHDGALSTQHPNQLDIFVRDAGAKEPAADRA
jgi:hypothetical protein